MIQFAIFAFLPVFTMFAWWYYKIVVQFWNHLNQRIENIYIVGLEDPANVPAELQPIEKLCIFVSNEWVDSTVAKWNGYLERSENPLYHSKKVVEKRRMKVIGYIFQDAEWVNETEVDYHKRVRASVDEDKASVHYFLKLTNPEWYAIYGNKQKGVKLK